MAMAGEVWRRAKSAPDEIKLGTGNLPYCSHSFLGVLQ